MKRFKKIASLILAMVMVLGIAMPTFAAGSTYTLGINTVANHTYKIYQLATGDISADGKTLSNIAVGQNAKTGTNVEAIKALVGKSGAELGEAAANLVELTGTPIATVVGDGGSKTATLPGGYYVIIDAYTDGNNVADGDSLSRTMVTLVQNTTITPKDTTIKPDKKIIEENQEVDTNEASIGDTITYKLSGLIPDMQDFKTFKFVFVDTMSKGLTPNLTEAQKNGTELLKGKVGDVEADFKVTSCVTDETTGITTIRIALVNAINYAGQKGQIVSVNINATLNKDAVITAESNDNKMKIDYSNDSNHEYGEDPDFKPDDIIGETPEIEVKTYTTSLELSKIDGETRNILTGAEFQLKGEGVKIGYVSGTEYVEASDGEWYQLKDGTYTKDAPTPDTEDKYADISKKYKLEVVNKTEETNIGATTQRAFVGADGKLVFTGLGKGTYTLSEVTTPDGYNTMKDITFTIDWSEATGFTVNMAEGTPDGITIGVNTATITEDNKNQTINTTLSSTIPNNKGSLLPSTGGIGTTIFYIIGGILVIGAGIILVVKKRASNE